MQSRLGAGPLKGENHLREGAHTEAGSGNKARLRQGLFKSGVAGRWAALHTGPLGLDATEGHHTCALLGDKPGMEKGEGRGGWVGQDAR